MSTPYPTLFQGNVKIDPGLDTALYGLGTIEVSTAPTSNFQVATKKYVDDAISGLDWKEACAYKTVGPLSTAVTPVGAQAGKTLTNAGVQVALVIDGVAVALNDRILVDSYGTGGVAGVNNVDNGLYVVTNIGSGVSNWVLTRAADADGTPNNEVDNGMTVLITSGVTAAGTTWTLVSAIDPVVVDTDPQIFVQSGAGAALTWAQVLLTGNVSGTNDAVMTNGYLIRGTDAATGGALSLRGGNSSGASPGGNVTITSGQSGAANTSGGNITLTAEDGTPAAGTDSIGAVVTVQGGQNTGAGGEVSIIAGDNNDIGSGNGGAITVQSGNANRSASSGGSIQISSGVGNVAGSSGGAIDILTGGVTSGIGSTGALTLSTGSTAGTGASGALDIETGSTITGTAGDINLTAGSASGAGTGGSIQIQAGTTIGGINGTIELKSPTNVTTAGNLYMPINQVPGTVTSLIRITGVSTAPTANPEAQGGHMAFNESNKDLYVHEGSGIWARLFSDNNVPTLAQVLASGNDTNGTSIINSVGDVTVGDNLQVTGSTSTTNLSATNTTNQFAVGTGPNITTLNYPAPSGAVVLTFPNTTDTIVARNTTDTLTNKTLTNTTNSARATVIGTSGANVVISGTAPTAGQVLTASSAIAASWQTPTTGTVTSITVGTGLTASPGSPITTTGTISLTIPVLATSGGTGFTTYVIGDILSADTATTLSRIADVATGNVLLSGGIGALPLYGKVGLTTHVSGILPIANGGTNSSTALNNNRIMVSSGGAIVEAAALTNGQLLIGSTGAAPVAATITAGSGIAIVNGTGSITIAAINSGTVTSIAAGTGLTASPGSPITSSGTISLTIPVLATSGGTGQTTYVVGDILSADTATTLSRIADVATGNVLLSGGVGTLPLYGKVGLTTHVSGILPIANGGTNSSTALSNNRIMVSSGGAIVEASALTNGQLLIGSTGAAPVAAVITAGSGIAIVNGTGSITIAAINSGTVTSITVGTGLTASPGSPITTTGTISLTIPVLATSGGTGQTTYVVGDILSADTTTTLSRIADIATGNVLLSGGVGVLPLYGKVGLTTHVSGVLPIANGGTNSSTALSNNRVMVSSGGAIVEAAALTNGQLLIGSTGAAPVAAAITAGSGITVTNGAGSITIAAINSGTVTSITAGTGLTASPGNPITTAGTISLTIPVVATSGGTGFTTYAVGDILAANTTTTLSRVADVATGNVLLSGGVGVLPLYGKVGLTTHVSGILPIANGGTNSSAVLSNNRIMVSSGGAIVESTALTNGQLLIGSTGLAPVAAAITAGSGITVTNGAGSITIAAINSGTVTSITVGAGLTASPGSPITTTGTISLTIPVLATSGGTGFTTYAVGDILAADTTTTLSRVADVATGNVLLSGGVGVLPLYGKVGLTTHVSGVLPIANGGTNSSTALTNDRIMVSSGGAIVVASALTNGQLLIGSTGAAPVAAAITAGSGITIANGAGSITIAAINSGTVTSITAGTGLTASPGNPITSAGTISLTIPVLATSGGTGFTTYAVGDILAADTTTTLSRIADIATGNVLLSGGVGVLPLYGKVGLTTHVSGTLPIANGGTNSSTALNNNRIMVSSGGAIVEAAALTNGQLLIGSTGAAPVAAAITAGAGITVTNGAGSITVALTVPVVATNGGTGQTVYAVGDILAANTTTTLSRVADVATGNVLLSGGVGVLPLYGKVGLTTHVSGILPIANGGTNSSTALTNNRIMVSSGGAIVVAAALTNGQLLIGSTGLAPVAAAITAGTGITITNGAGSITVALTVPVVATNGGTGQTVYAVGDILSADTTTTLSRIADVATGNVLLSGGVGVLPLYGKVGLTTHVSGILPIANGGTNSATALNNNRIMVSSGGAIVEAAALTNGQLLIGSTGAAPVAAAITAGAGISVTNGAGSITIAATAVSAVVQRISVVAPAVGAAVVTTNDVVFITTTGAGVATGTMGSATDGKTIRIVYVSRAVGTTYALSLTGFDANGGAMTTLTFSQRGHSAVLTWDNVISAWFITGGSGVGVS